MKIVSWNVNGIRAVHKKGFLDWFKSESADLICLQEVKCTPEQVKGEESILHPSGYFSAWNSAEKPGYSGVLIYSRKEPLNLRHGLGVPEFDSEGRWLEADFRFEDFSFGRGEFTLISCYFPNSQRDHARLPFKLAFCSAAEKRLEQLRQMGRQVLICGDWNIAHKEIDLKNPKTNADNAGFLPQERAWMDHMITDLGWVDIFRKFEPGPGHYTWWSYRPGVREKNIGWRLDYFLTNPEWQDRMKSSIHLPDVLGSDHCPVRLTLKD